jgi:arginyl-tRNA synthetase
MLTRKNDAALEFDVDLVLEQSKDNPVFYVQYAHARCRSVLRNMGELPTHAPDLTTLTHPLVLSLIRRLASWPRVVEQAAIAYEPHRIVGFLQELAAEFHSLWNQGNSEPSLRFIDTENPERTHAYSQLVEAVAIIIASGLECVGVTPAETM